MKLAVILAITLLLYCLMGPLAKASRASRRKARRDQEVVIEEIVEDDDDDEYEVIKEDYARPAKKCKKSTSYKKKGGHEKAYYDGDDDGEIYYSDEEEEECEGDDSYGPEYRQRYADDDRRPAYGRNYAQGRQYAQANYQGRRGNSRDRDRGYGEDRSCQNNRRPQNVFDVADVHEERPQPLPAPPPEQSPLPTVTIDDMPVTISNRPPPQPTPDQDAPVAQQLPPNPPVPLGRPCDDDCNGSGRRRPGQGSNQRPPFSQQPLQPVHRPQPAIPVPAQPQRPGSFRPLVPGPSRPSVPGSSRPPSAPGSFRSPSVPGSSRPFAPVQAPVVGSSPQSPTGAAQTLPGSQRPSQTPAVVFRPVMPPGPIQWPADAVMLEDPTQDPFSVPLILDDDGPEDHDTGQDGPADAVLDAHAERPDEEESEDDHGVGGGPFAPSQNPFMPQHYQPCHHHYSNYYGPPVSNYAHAGAMNNDHHDPGSAPHLHPMASPSTPFVVRQSTSPSTPQPNQQTPSQSLLSLRPEGAGALQSAFPGMRQPSPNNGQQKGAHITLQGPFNIAVNRPKNGNSSASNDGNKNNGRKNDSQLRRGDTVDYLDRTHFCQCTQGFFMVTKFIDVRNLKVACAAARDADGYYGEPAVINSTRKHQMAVQCIRDCLGPQVSARMGEHHKRSSASESVVMRISHYDRHRKLTPYRLFEDVEEPLPVLCQL